MAIERADELFLTVREVAERLRVHPITVRRHIKAGRLRAVRIGRSVRVRPGDLEAFLQPEIASAVGLPYRWPPTPEELERRKKLIEEARIEREGMAPLGITTAELVRLARTAREWMYKDDE